MQRWGQFLTNARTYKKNCKKFYSVVFGWFGRLGSPWSVVLRSFAHRSPSIRIGFARPGRWGLIHSAGRSIRSAGGGLAGWGWLGEALQGWEGKQAREGKGKPLQHTSPNKGREAKPAPYKRRKAPNHTSIPNQHKGRNTSPKTSKGREGIPANQDTSIQTQNKPIQAPIKAKEYKNTSKPKQAQTSHKKSPICGASFVGAFDPYLSISLICSIFSPLGFAL